MDVFDSHGFSLVSLLSLGVYAWALIDYFRRRPPFYWLFVIFFLGPLGCAIYLIVVVLPNSGIDESLKSGARERRRRRELEHLAGEEAAPGHLAELGEIYVREGRFADGATKLARAIELGIDHDDARYYLAIAYERLNRPRDAVRELVGIVRRDPSYRFGEAFIALGRCLENLGELRDAKDAYREVLKTKSYAEARYRLALILEKEGNSDEAAALMRAIVGDARVQPAFARRAERAWVSKARGWLSAHPDSGASA
ncbi:tetratricopeptide repeat protein [bacterium]|nr:tetratricopeptide repeat protein [bacterium]